MTFDFFFEQLNNKNTMMDEICFCFKDDETETEHFVGYTPKYKNGIFTIINDKPYWAGLCDIPNGCAFTTAEELVNARIYHGKSLQEVWDDITIFSIAGLDVKDWIEIFNKSNNS